MEFINSKNGRTFISKIKNKVIFADLKLHDIPNTCSSTIKALKDLRINYLTIHISSGLEALKLAKKVSGKIKLVGVTTLTSLDNKNLKEIGYNKSIKNLIIHNVSHIIVSDKDPLFLSCLLVKILVFHPLQLLVLIE